MHMTQTLPPTSCVGQVCSCVLPINHELRLAFLIDDEQQRAIKAEAQCLDLHARMHASRA
jgi:hypothetical protein